MGSKYALGVKSWRVNWPELSTMFKYPPEIRTLIYTTTPLRISTVSCGRSLKRRAPSFPTALMKILYLATMNITEKWTMPIRNWGTILDHLMIYFGDRVEVRI